VAPQDADSARGLGGGLEDDLPEEALVHEVRAGERQQDGGAFWMAMRLMSL
jgi:hypothetical protein